MKWGPIEPRSSRRANWCYGLGYKVFTCKCSQTLCANTRGMNPPRPPLSRVLVARERLSTSIRASRCEGALIPEQPLRRASPMKSGLHNNSFGRVTDALLPSGRRRLITAEAEGPGDLKSSRRTPPRPPATEETPRGEVRRRATEPITGRHKQLAPRGRDAVTLSNHPRRSPHLISRC